MACGVSHIAHNDDQGELLKSAFQTLLMACGVPNIAHNDVNVLLGEC